ncbi:YceI family protein [Polaribacter batillariae]|uniref:YceI family protein n=1 Tax=Polaribacter batillariae TaxID=2808900 RepID=A0ABX7SZI3_9FLAO|nr:YceI family protein [Polaribacter batillariae]QTD38703.1 YceI family protein [Polaribacter batillariae]
MKKIILSIVVAASVLTACKNKKEKVEVKEAVKVEVNAADLNNVNTEASVISWKGTKPTGAHDGTVALKSGGLVVEDGELKNGVFVIDMTTIKNEDMKGSEGAGKLEGHLSSPDFFDVAKYPTSKFVITSVKENEGKLAVTGNLTLKDITKSITIPATISTEGNITTFKSETFNVDRTDFGVTYKSKKIDAALKDKFIDDIMELQFTVVTK